MKKWTFKPVDRDTPDLFPAAVQDYLPEEHLARFVVDVVDQLDIHAFVKAYRGVGSKAWHPSMTAKAEIERRAEARYQQERAEYEEKMARREARKQVGKAPKAPESGPRDKDQVNLTDEESRIMPTSGGGFEQAYNAQASVDNDSGLIITRHVTQATNDKQEIKPTLAALAELEPVAGKA